VVDQGGDDSSRRSGQPLVEAVRGGEEMPTPANSRGITTASHGIGIDWRMFPKGSTPFLSRSLAAAAGPASRFS